MAVMTEPDKNPVKRLRVIAPNAFLRCAPVSFCRPSLMVFIPNIISARQPSILNNVNIAIYVNQLLLLFLFRATNSSANIIVFSFARKNVGIIVLKVVNTL